MLTLIKYLAVCPFIYLVLECNLPTSARFKIDDEIITYTGITPTSFTGCIRGFSGISGHNVGISSSLLEINRESLIFEDTTASSHASGDKVTNLSVLFLHALNRTEFGNDEIVGQRRFSD